MNLLSILFGKKDNSALENVLKNNPFLVDVRTPSEFASGSVEGAQNIPLSEIKNQISKFKNKNQIIVFCRSGNRSSIAKGTLEKNDISNVVNGGSLENVVKTMQKIKNIS
ncbi:rhodanese-like domain-containing protein [Chryseobacterium sp. PS-8]|uniref:Rhodanese-like domain-containing protein n=1 Tax=Chryseobacterium indicum TaxID=2766954 RepID=A0ABS9C2H5_9FLAO|nr:rhodanese-like domain-containing protein [Chryseobacterium sp. PS-8]MCF2218422.1 rhodanese-like domain-containing protein [Chryseobacterium sp. PS-8]